MAERIRTAAGGDHEVRAVDDGPDQAQDATRRNRMTGMLDDVRARLAHMVEEDPERGIFRARRDMFTDPDLFDLEMRYIFEGNWIYLAHETQLPNNNDYITMFMGRQPVIVSRTRDGELTAVLNACAHRGAMVCRRKKDNRATWTCPFHGWSYNNSGKLLKVKEAKGAGYPEQFNKDGSHDMPKVPRFESYRGFLFGSLNPDVLPLQEHLGETTKMIDLMVDASPDGLEVLKGASTYTYDGNWKVQAENGADGYHVAATHWNYAATTARRSDRRVRHRDQGDGRGQLRQDEGRLLRLRARARRAVDDAGQPRGRAAVRAPPGADRPVRPGEGRLDDRRRAQPLPVPERLPDGPVQLADPAVPAHRGRPDRGHHPLHRAQGREPRGPGAGSVSTRTSSTRPAWPRRTTWRSSGPASTATWPAPLRGTT